MTRQLSSADISLTTVISLKILILLNLLLVYNTNNRLKRINIYNSYTEMNTSKFGCMVVCFNSTIRMA